MENNATGSYIDHATSRRALEHHIPRKRHYGISIINNLNSFLYDITVHC